MSQCKAQHTIGSTTRFCLRQVEDGHVEHVDFMGLTFEAQEPVSGEIVYFAEIVDG